MTGVLLECRSEERDSAALPEATLAARRREGGLVGAETRRRKTMRGCCAVMPGGVSSRRWREEKGEQSWG